MLHLGNDLFGEPVPAEQHGSRLAATFDYPPFSVLNAREGWWQERKRAWLSLGIKSEVGRGANTLGLSEQCEDYRTRTGSEYARTFGQDLMRGEHTVGGGKLAPGQGSQGESSAWMKGGRVQHDAPGGYSGSEKSAWTVTEDEDGNANGTSIFDPVLTELAYRWFAPPAGLIIDPFAGGSVRGIVASVLGYEYTGFELREAQVDANRAQAARICNESVPEWICGDSARTVPLWQQPGDFLFSCPPYGNLEVYSDDPADISAMEHAAFLDAYRGIIAAACAKLKEDRFAAFVVGDFRCKRGFYRNFPGETVAAFEAAGLRLYNEAILVTAVGSLPVRVGRQFRSGRKLGKTHQNLLVFVKGCPRLAAAACNGQGELFNAA